jgi:hypothetical protein
MADLRTGAHAPQERTHGRDADEYGAHAAPSLNSNVRMARAPVERKAFLEGPARNPRAAT